jgi:ADP-heptose:LPS heptosyltransferase
MNQLGDLLFSLPVLASARKQWPEKRMISVVRPALAPILKASGLVDDIVLRPHAGIVAPVRLVADVRRQHMHMAVLFSQSPASLITAVMSAIPRRVGFGSASLSFLLTETVASSGVPSLENNKNLGIKIGLSEIAEDYTGLVAIPEVQRIETLRWLGKMFIPTKQLILLSPGASRRRKDKCWPADRWATLADQLTGSGWHPVFIGAPSERVELDAIVRLCAIGVPVFCAEKGILSLVSLIRHARVFIGIDSGAMHLAASGGTPVIALFASTDPVQVGPRPLAKHQIIQRDTMDSITVEDICNVLKNTRVC